MKKVAYLIMAIVATIVTGVASVIYLSEKRPSYSKPSTISKSIYQLLEQSEFKSINFSGLAGNSWTKLCFLGPYNVQSSKALGFEWRVDEHTSVLSGDGHNVLLFATDSEVVEYVIHSRGRGDFSKLSGKCFNRESSNFIRDPESKNWRNYIHSE